MVEITSEIHVKIETVFL